MKTQLQCRADRLFAQATCPNCRAHKTGSYRAQELRRSTDTADTPSTIGAVNHLAGDLAVVRYYCGCEIALDEKVEMVGRMPCAFAMMRLLEGLEAEADHFFEGQEKAA